MKKEIKRISLMTATFLTVALVSSAVEAGVIRINGTIAGSESLAPFPNPAEGIFVNASVMSTDTALGPFTLFYSLVVDFAFRGTQDSAPGASRLVVGDPTNGDSILVSFRDLTVAHAPTAVFAMWIPGPLSAERAGTLVLKGASPRTNARTLLPARPLVPSAAPSS